MTSVNKVILIGRLGKDPETRYMHTGDAVSNVSIACTESWKDKNGEKQERTEWVNVVFYRKLAEIVKDYLRKGSLVYIEGKLQTEKWTKDGIDRYTTKVIASEMKMLGSKKNDSSQEHDSEQKHNHDSSEFADMEDDIPF